MFIISNEEVLNDGLCSRLWCVWEAYQDVANDVQIIIHPLSGSEKHLFGKKGRRGFNPEENAHCGPPGWPMGDDEKRIRRSIGDLGWKLIEDKIRSTCRYFVAENRVNVAKECLIGPGGIELLLKAIVKDTHIMTLDLSCSDLDCHSAVVLAERLNCNATLQWLYLHHNEIRDDGAEVLADALKGNRTLKLLDLRSNSIGNVGAKALANALEINDVLEDLWLTANEIGNDGAKALADALGINRTLRFLNLLDNNHIDKDSREALKEALGKKVNVST
eukprot:NODE_1649_length_1094_cov_398.637151.p1 GENE.NODE_1649_length_1094_cov_398.637151~~NODE_1649_length_1094_cov_398.637151.p1  ORF type:complete len:303 (-),score=85.54 NODE_1649_length_1094_cov_398.637151:170-997(-)